MIRHLLPDTKGRDLCRNTTTDTIPAGTLVVITGMSADWAPEINVADAADVPAYGWTIEDIAPDALGLVGLSGLLTGLNTSAHTAGDLLYLGDTGGAFGDESSFGPAVPKLRQLVGIVRVSDLTEGVIQIYMFMDASSGLDEGRIPAARLGSGVRNGTKFLRDDRVWVAGGPGGGEVNTASNVGASGVGVFKQKTDVDLEFKQITAGSAKVTIVDDTGNDTVELDVDADEIVADSGALADAFSGVATSLASKVPATRTVNGHALSGDVTVTKGDVGLGSCDNTSDAGKPVSTAQQAALDLKAPLASPTFTGTVAGVTAAMVGAPATTRTITINDVTQDLAADRTWVVALPDPMVTAYPDAPGSITALTATSTLILRRLALTGSQRYTMQGTARVMVVR